MNRQFCDVCGLEVQKKIYGTYTLELDDVRRVRFKVFRVFDTNVLHDICPDCFLGFLNDCLRGKEGE